MGVWMKHKSDPHVRGITVPGPFRYEAREGGIVEVHPAHVADLQGAGFEVMKAPDSVPAVTTTDPAASTGEAKPSKK